jgi:hypothetical protein
MPKWALARRTIEAILPVRTPSKLLLCVDKYVNNFTSETRPTLRGLTGRPPVAA